MFRETDRQIPLFVAGATAPKSIRDRLEQSWAVWFRQVVLPELLGKENLFSGLYGERGRPNWSVARLLGLCLLQHLEDLSDQHALDALSFDMRWQHALDLAPEEAYLSRRSLVEFRRRLVKADPSGALLRAVFDHVTSVGLRDLHLSTAKQRLDSTLIASNIQGRGRLSLARETLRVFLRTLDEAQLRAIPDAIRAWYAKEDEGWGPPENQTEAAARLTEMGQWIGDVLEAFAADEQVKVTEPYELLQRLLREHGVAFGVTSQVEEAPKSEPPDDDPPSPPVAKRGRKKKRNKRNKRNKKGGKAARFWSPHDPGASFGHKGLGYHVHVTETCGNQTTELLTDYEVVTAAESDVGHAQPVIDRLKERGLAPKELYADGGYPTPSSLLVLRANGTELQAPVHRGRLPKDAFSRADFTINDEGEVVACPAGHAPTHHGPRNSSDTATTRRSLHAFFDAETCRGCEHLERCPVRTPNNSRSKAYRLDLAPELIARDERWSEQQSDEWRAKYRIRSGVEATMSELKRGHGLGRLRVRRTKRVRLQVALKVTACNLKRWWRAARRIARPGRPAPGPGRALLALIALLRGLGRSNPSHSRSLGKLLV